jgi:hypothetical protein
VPPMTAHHVHGRDGGPCQFMVLHGIGVYDNMRVGTAGNWPDRRRSRRQPRRALSTRHLSSSGACTPTVRSLWPDRATQKFVADGPIRRRGRARPCGKRKTSRAVHATEWGDNYGASCIVGADSSSSVERSGRHGGRAANLRNHRLSANAAPTYGAKFRHCSRAIARSQSHACKHASIPGSDWRLNPPPEAGIRGQGGKPGAQLKAGHRSISRLQHPGEPLGKNLPPG